MDQTAFTSLKANGRFVIDDSQFGALKNEYPLNRDSDRSAITQIRVLNKKIYQVRVNGAWSSKFKGCTRPTNDIFDHFMSEGLHQQTQTRFIKNTSSISIQQRDMSYRLRLSREVVPNLNEDHAYNSTTPFESTRIYRERYPSSKSYIRCVEGAWITY